jgi:hypothetical protein
LRVFNTQIKAVRWARSQEKKTGWVEIVLVPNRGLITFWRDDKQRLCWSVSTDSEYLKAKGFITKSEYPKGDEGITKSEYPKVEEDEPRVYTSECDDEG